MTIRKPPGLDDPTSGGAADDDDSFTYQIDHNGKRFKVDKYGERVRVTGRPPHIPSQIYKKMSYVKQQQAKADYQKTLDAAKTVPKMADPSTSVAPDTAALCTGVAPLGIYGMLFQDSA